MKFDHLTTPFKPMFLFGWFIDGWPCLSLGEPQFCGQKEDRSIKWYIQFSVTFEHFTSEYFLKKGPKFILEIYYIGSVILSLKKQ